MARHLTPLCAALLTIAAEASAQTTDAGNTFATAKPVTASRTTTLITETLIAGIVYKKDTPPVGGDVDFFRVSGLKPGAFTVQAFDATLAMRPSLLVYDATGTVLRSSNNGGKGPFGNIPEIRSDTDVYVPASGILTFAVTGAGDGPPDSHSDPPGAHAQGGPYTVRIIQPGGLGADMDDDGDVDKFDLDPWKVAIKDRTAAGDADRNFLTDGGDFILWQRQLGKTSAIAATSAVPEPASLLLCWSLLMTVACARRYTTMGRLPSVAGAGPSGP